MRYIRIIFSGASIITKLFSFIYSKVQEYRRNKETKKMIKLKDDTAKNIEDGDINKINDNLKF